MKALKGTGPHRYRTAPRKKAIASAPHYDAMDLAVQLRNAQAREKRALKQVLEAARDVAALHALRESLAGLQLDFGPASAHVKDLAYQRHRDAAKKAEVMLYRHDDAKLAVAKLYAQLQQVSP